MLWCRWRRLNFKFYILLTTNDMLSLSLVTILYILIRTLVFNVTFLLTFFLFFWPQLFSFSIIFWKKGETIDMMFVVFQKKRLFGIFRFSGEWLEFIRFLERMKKENIYLFIYCILWEYELNLSGLLKCRVVLAHNEDLPVSGRSSYCHFPHQNVNPNEWSLDSLLGFTYQSTIPLAIYVSDSEISIIEDSKSSSYSDHIVLNYHK
jgi:hypothetical protein